MNQDEQHTCDTLQYSSHGSRELDNYPGGGNPSTIPEPKGLRTTFWGGL